MATYILATLVSCNREELRLWVKANDLYFNFSSFGILKGTVGEIQGLSVNMPQLIANESSSCEDVKM